MSHDNGFRNPAFRGGDFGSQDARRHQGDARHHWGAPAHGPASEPAHDLHDPDYHEWRRAHLAQLDADYDAYRRERSARFAADFEQWRGQRAASGHGAGNAASGVGASASASADANARGD